LNVSKEELGQAFSDKSIDTRPFFYPLSLLPAFACYKAETQRAHKANVNAYAISKRAINLPSSLSLTEDQVEYVSEVLLQTLGLEG
jgi:perosamine synthetase